VDATSGGNAWAVGDYVVGTAGQTLAVHCAHPARSWICAATNISPGTRHLPRIHLFA